MAKYDLTGSLETSFTFTIEDKEFSFRKPTVREMRELAKLHALVEQEEDPEKQIENSDKAMQSLYQFITPVGHDSKIDDVLNNQPISVQIEFNNMIQKELGVSQ